jgi:hypothetical protein
MSQLRFLSTTGLNQQNSRHHHKHQRDDYHPDERGDKFMPAKRAGAHIQGAGLLAGRAGLHYRQSILAVSPLSMTQIAKA